MAGQFPYDVTKILTGRHRVLFTPVTGSTVPVWTTDVISNVSPYGVTSPWTDAGGTGGPADYSLTIAKQGIDAQQVSEPVKEEIQSTTRTFSFVALESSTLIQALSEESPGVVTRSPGTGHNAEKAVDFGSISELTRYRVAILAMFNKSDGLVTEPSGGTRGCWAGGLFYNCEIDAGTYQQSFGEGAARLIPITLKMFPDPTITAEGKQTGRWITEQAGTIA